MRCVWMPGNMNKWATRHRKIAKSGHRVAAETIPFRRRWRGCMISVNLEAIWRMSVQSPSPRFGFSSITEQSNLFATTY